MRALQKSFEALKPTKNLLALSCGADSTALFFLLTEHGVEFDAAIVDYNVRAQSKDEVTYAKKLCAQFKKRLFIKSVHLQEANFEANARKERYEFFGEIIAREGYERLILAHHLNDRLEWFFMRLVRGSGAVELCGFDEIESRENYDIVRPLLRCSKEELIEYLREKDIKYFVDESNFDEKYERNFWRKNYAAPLLERFQGGISRTFELLSEDKKELLPQNYRKIGSLYLFSRSSGEMRLIAKIAKFFGVVLSQKQREEAQMHDECVLSGKIAVGKNDQFVFIAPYLKEQKMDKEFKERARIAKIPTNVRAYIYAQNLDLSDILNALADKL